MYTFINYFLDCSVPFRWWSSECNGVWGCRPAARPIAACSSAFRQSRRSPVAPCGHWLPPQLAQLLWNNAGELFRLYHLPWPFQLYSCWILCLLLTDSQWSSCSRSSDKHCNILNGCMNSNTDWRIFVIFIIRRNVRNVLVLVKFTSSSEFRAWQVYVYHLVKRLCSNFSAYLTTLKLKLILYCWKNWYHFVNWLRSYLNRIFLSIVAVVDWLCDGKFQCNTDALIH